MKAGRKVTGGKYKRPKKKKKTGRQSQTRIVKLAETKTKKVRIRGGSKKTIALTENKVNVVNKGKSVVTLIKNVLETPSNSFLARQNVLLKGSIIETELGKAKITNRPSQEGNVQAVILTE
jgi:small subunit ribosomal protein S8e